MKNRIVVIGASMHGIEALRRLVAALPPDFPAPIFVAQHIGRDSLGFLPEILSRAGPLEAVHPQSLERFEPGRIYVAPPDRHMLLEDRHVYLSRGPRENFVRPAVDPLFRSAALSHGPAVVGVVLTGQLDDGTAGLLAIKDNGGTAIVQDPEEAMAPSMPRSALRHVKVDHCLPIAGIATRMLELALDDPATAGAAPDRLLLEIEHRIACGIFRGEDRAALQRRSSPTAMKCPLCRSALREIIDRRLLRFRCGCGHACSALSLLDAMPVCRENTWLAAGLRDRVERLQRETGQVAAWTPSFAAPP